MRPSGHILLDAPMDFLDPPLEIYQVDKIKQKTNLKLRCLDIIVIAIVGLEECYCYVRDVYLARLFKDPTLCDTH